MEVNLIEYTGRPDPWRAADVMIFTKSTRVAMDPGKLDEIAAWSEEKKRDELAYMANTIPSSWEFCDYTFVLSGVTRALTHQLVRTRTASYAQQTMQILDVKGWDYLEGRSIAENDGWHEVYQGAMKEIAYAYDHLVASGARVEDARGLLPTHILTNIVVKMNLRTLVDLFHSRVSPRNLGEFRDVLVVLLERIREVHPWVDLFLERTTDKALAELDDMIRRCVADVLSANRMHKMVDQIRRRS